MKHAIPDGIAGTRLFARHGHVVGVNLWMVGQNQAEQGGLPAAVLSEQDPLLAGLHAPIHVIKQGRAKGSHRHVPQIQQWFAGWERGRGHGREENWFRFARWRDGAWATCPRAKKAVIFHLRHVGDSHRQIIRARRGEDDRDPLGGKRVQRAEEIPAMPVIEAREGFVHAQEKRVEHKRPGQEESM